jgi:Protein of unknown function (DUF2946)
VHPYNYHVYCMGTVRHHRGPIAWVALVALIGNLVLGMFCSVPLKSPALDPLLGAVICTSHGEQAPADENPAPAPSKPCQICTAAVALSLVLLVTALLGLLPQSRPRWAAFRLITALADGLRRDGLGSRAPPLPA